MNKPRISPKSLKFKTCKFGKLFISMISYSIYVSHLKTNPALFENVSSRKMGPAGTYYKIENGDDPIFNF